MTNAEAIEAKLATLPHLTALLEPDSTIHEALGRAWQAGATEWCEIHPLIDILLGEDRAPMRETIERGLPHLTIDPDVARDLRGRATSEARDGYSSAAAALTELYAACRLALAGASARLVPPDPMARQPDLEASKEAANVTLEAYGLHMNAEDKEEQDAFMRAFSEWPRGEAPPEALRGRAREYGGGLRMLERVHMPFGPGTTTDRIDRLTKKIGKKANRGQLAGSPHGVLVVGSWHVFGPSSDDLAPSTRRRGTSLIRAALLGRNGDDVVEPVEFEGHVPERAAQVRDGVLVSPCDARAILWLFHAGRPCLVETAASTLPASTRALLLEAFDADHIVG